MALAGDIREVAGNVKSDKASGKDESFLTSVMDKIGSLQKMVSGTDNELTGDTAKKYGSIVSSMLPQVQELQKRVEQVAGSKSPDQLAASGDNAKDIVNNVTRKLKDFTSTIDQLEQDLKKAKSEAPKTPKGKGFLSLFS